MPDGHDANAVVTVVEEDDDVFFKFREELATQGQTSKK